MKGILHDNYTYPEIEYENGFLGETGIVTLRKVPVYDFPSMTTKEWDNLVGKEVEFDLMKRDEDGIEIAILRIESTKHIDLVIDGVISLTDGLRIQWSSPLGFGEFDIYIDGCNWIIDSECMDKEFAKTLLSKLVDYCKFK